MSTTFDLNVKVSTSQIAKDNLTKVTLSAPDTGKRQPSVFIAILDVSGSMSSEATLKTAGQVESQGFSRLDLVKHSMKTVISVLDGDYLCLLTFSDRAKQVLPLTMMDDAGRTKAHGIVDGLHTEGSTNIWDGLKCGIEVAKMEKCQGRNVVLLLLTDGEPSTEYIPKEGIVGALSNFMGNFKMNDFTIHSFGFGYSLDTKLMLDICKVGGGSYGYIPDCSMVGTVFVNFTSNVLSTAARNVVVRVGKESFALGAIQFGQQRTALLKNIKTGGTLEVWLKYDLLDEKKVECKVEEKDDTIYNQFAVQKLQDIVTKILEKNDLKLGQKLFKEFKKTIEGFPVKTPFLELMLRDTESTDENEGQLLRAVSSEDWFNRWGKNHLIAFARAHQLEQCINFKDKSIQLYAGPMCKEFQTEGNRVFCSLPPPPPSCKSYSSSSTPSTPVNMAYYMNDYGGCFDGNGMVSMADTTSKRVMDLKKGDILASGAKVICLIETKTEKVDMVDVEGVLLTPWHPIMKENVWVFPSSLKPASPVKIPAIYNLVLQDGCTVTINGVPCISLGHGLTDNDVVKHPYFGTDLVIQDLTQLAGWDKGHVVITNPKVERDARGLVRRMF